MATIIIQGRKITTQSWKVGLFLQRIEKLIEKEKRNGTYFLRSVKKSVDDKGYYTNKQEEAIKNIEEGVCYGPRRKIERFSNTDR